MISPGSQADEVRVAVASNFSVVIKKLKQSFEQNSEHAIVLVIGSTGKHYAQIRNGAPFDIFFAADRLRPEKLENEGLIIPGSRKTYAIGKIILWSPDPDLIDSGGQVIAGKQFHYLSIANPKLAPYGKAAQEVLQGFGLWDKLRSRLVRGENITQTFQYVKSGNAELGFVALSQIVTAGDVIEGSFWEVPQKLYSSVEQQLVLLRDSVAARDFLAFIRSEPARSIIQDFGYSLPDA